MPRHWLMKSEPDDYSIDDLAREGRTYWSGVRNYQARNLLRDEIKVGDPVLFYHSNAEPSGVVGLAKVASEPYPDPTQFDADSPYFEPRATPSDAPWVVVDVAFGRKFTRVISLDEIKADAELEGMEVRRKGNRLSVQPVSEAHYLRVVRLATMAQGDESAADSDDAIRAPPPSTKSVASRAASIARSSSPTSDSKGGPVGKPRKPASAKRSASRPTSTNRKPAGKRSTAKRPVKKRAG
jgi:predicted RNA-binding protein with PUA-like domain